VQVRRAIAGGTDPTARAARLGRRENPDRKANAGSLGRTESLGRQVNKARVANQDRPVSFLRSNR
jgi:hypothetical protein